MKISDKIRAVLKQYPEIQRRKTQINAISYLQKKNSNMEVKWSSRNPNPNSNNNTYLYVWENFQAHVLTLKPLSQYTITSSPADPASSYAP